MASTGRVLGLGLVLLLAAGLRADPAGVLAALGTGDLGAAYRALVAGYQAAGAEFPPWLELREQSAFEPLSRWTGDGTIVQSRLLAAGQGLEYWRGWAAHLGASGWDPEAALGSEDQARELGNFALVGILAHELAHAIADLEGLNPPSRPGRELLADELAMRLLRGWTGPDRLVALRQAYREAICGALRRAVPDGTRIELPPGGGLAGMRAAVAALVLPDDLPVAGYVSLQLARQAILLDEPDLSSLEAFLAERRAARPARVAYRDRVHLATVSEAEVPAWVREAGSDGPPPGLSAAALEALTATLGLATLDPTPVRNRVGWKATGPGRWLGYVAESGSGTPVRLVGLDAPRGEGGAWVGAVLGEGPATLWHGAGLVPSGHGAALASLARGPGGLALRTYRAEPGTGRLVPGPLDGTPVSGEAVPDGPLAILPAPRVPRGLAFDGTRVFVSTGAAIRVVEGGRLATLAGGLASYRDGEDPARVRLAETELLALESDRLWLRTRGPGGPRFRSLSW